LIEERNQRAPFAALNRLPSIAGEAEVNRAPARQSIKHAIDRSRRNWSILGIARDFGLVDLQAIARES